MKNAAELLAEVALAGVRVDLKPDGATLHVVPRERCTPELVERLRSAKPALVDYLRRKRPAATAADDLKRLGRGVAAESVAALPLANPANLRINADASDLELLDEARLVLGWREIDCEDWLTHDLPRKPAWARAALRECIDLVLRLRATCPARCWRSPITSRRCSAKPAAVRAKRDRALA